MTQSLKGITVKYQYVTASEGWAKEENNIHVVFQPTSINKKMELYGD